MRGIQSDAQLRRSLQEITHTHIGSRAHEQIALIDALSHDHPHSISLAQEAISGKPETGIFNCIQYALDLVEPPDQIFRIACCQKDVGVGPKFVAWLVSNSILRPTDMDHADDRDLVLYFEGPIVKHAAKISGDRLISKWGSFHLWNHGLWEVPEAYGNEIRYFRAISRDAVSSAFFAPA